MKSPFTNTYTNIRTLREEPLHTICCLQAKYFELSQIQNISLRSEGTSFPHKTSFEKTKNNIS